MPFGPHHGNAPRLPLAALIALGALYLLLGVTGHDPWKTEDAIHIGIAHGIVSQGHWLFPHVAGEPWPHTAPLYHWLAALLGSIFGGWLPFHDAARLATPLFGALFLFSLARATQAYYGDAAGRIAPLLAIGTLGLLLPLHEAQPAVAGLAFAALSFWGAGLVQQGKRRGAWLIGLGLGLGFAAHGLAGTVMALAVLAAPTFRGDAKSLLLALGIALPLAVAWPLAVHLLAPELWQAWWQNEFAEATRARTLPEGRHVEQLAWAAWPVLPLALWSLWLHRRHIDRVLVPALGLLLAILWFLSGSSRLLSLLPAMVPMILLGAAGAEKLRRGAANAFDWFGVMTFSFFSLLIWLGASAQALDWPPQVARNFDKLAPGHTVSYSVATLVFCGAVSLAWLASWRLARAPWRASLHWAAGTTLFWALTVGLWFSWIDHAKTYRPVVASLQAALRQQGGCIERANLGSAQRASLAYFADITTHPPAREAACPLRLTIDDRGRATPAGWKPVWQDGRSSDRKERWYLERRSD